MECDRLGFIARFKPLHLGHAVVIEALCEHAREVIIGIGSANRYDLRNPFTVHESEEMVHCLLRPRHTNYVVKHLPDLGDGPRWRDLVRREFDALDGFATGNEYTAGLLRESYPLISLGEIVPPERRFFTSATDIRRLMASGLPWEHLVPPGVAAYLKKEGLVDRFRQEYGLATLAILLVSDLSEEQHTKFSILPGGAS